MEENDEIHQEWQWHAYNHSKSMVIGVCDYANFKDWFPKD
jgi:hypothetical protein